jgi:putative phage-type endonuclease
MIIQGSPEWRLLRAGKVTASRVKHVIAKTKSGYSTTRANYMDELIIERFGVISDGFTNAAMAHGTETEPLARSMFELNTGLMVAQIDFVDHPFIEMSGASPDGLIGNAGLLEIKCPNSTTHFNYLREGVVPEEHKPQMAWQMACTNRLWCDFVSFDPRVPEGLQYFQIRYERDDNYISEIEAEVNKFLDELESRYQELKLIMDKKAA